MRAVKNSSPRANPEPGTHMALLTQIIDWGTVKDKFGPRRKVELVWELPEDLHVFNEERGEEPFIVTRKFALDISKKSFLRRAIEGMTGTVIGDEFELEELLETICQLSTTNEQDGEYENVNILAYMAPPKGFKKKYRANGEVLILDLDNFDEKVFELLPDWKQDKIKESQEYKAIAGNKAARAPQKASKEDKKKIFH